jgi:hypothetical protein
MTGGVFHSGLNQHARGTVDKRPSGKVFWQRVFFFPPSLVVAGMAISRGCAWVTSATFLRERRGWLLFAIPWSCQPMERP